MVPMMVPVKRKNRLTFFARKMLHEKITEPSVLKLLHLHFDASAPLFLAEILVSAAIFSIVACPVSRGDNFSHAFSSRNKKESGQTQREKATYKGDIKYAQNNF